MAVATTLYVSSLSPLSALYFLHYMSEQVSDHRAQLCIPRTLSPCFSGKGMIQSDHVRKLRQNRRSKFTYLGEPC